MHSVSVSKKVYERLKERANASDKSIEQVTEEALSRYEAVSGGLWEIESDAQEAPWSFGSV